MSDEAEPLDGPAPELDRHAVKRAALLTEYSQHGNLTRACETVGVGRRTHYNWLETDELYARQFADAQEAAADRLEWELLTRAQTHLEDKEVPEGKKVVRGSDLLLIFLLKGLRPWKYRDNQKPDAEASGAATPLGWEQQQALSDLADEVVREREPVSD